MFLYSISAVIKPQWAYIWEYKPVGSTEWMRTPIELTERELESWLDDVLGAFDMPTTRPIESTRVDRNRVPLRDRRIKLKPVMPDFDAPTDAELRALWRDYTDLQVRWLILEILALRESLEHIQKWFDYVDKNVDDKGALSGGQGEFQRLRHLLRAEKRRAGMI
ncbi:hypothetical protein WJ55_23610 [Burkholderia ubonensis]|nr:hypothetical protein [Burkholderia ubonensis]KVG77237.1 hypothetical protein WJ34_02395 [Burkholderia ubonensis]KVH15777.1 hypothetical protein WJ37_31090 [Burkholderia ubonensis]KVH53132.1 hypothetical protein WJ38_03025 [Burkholderia ubonensis]KVH82313.1 hypothetical protein WJ43_26060 [Burkholderia ubonensis]KVM28962.1 hypothetical protein WJ55_23610 [Burkholderia ubonensis]